MVDHNSSNPNTTTQFSASQPPRPFLLGAACDLVLAKENCKHLEKVLAFLIQGRDANGATTPSFILLQTQMQWPEPQQLVYNDEATN